MMPNNLPPYAMKQFLLLLIEEICRGQALLVGGTEPLHILDTAIVKASLNFSKTNSYRSNVTEGFATSVRDYLSLCENICTLASRKNDRDTNRDTK